MDCRNCGGATEDRVTDLPFKVGETSIVIIKDLPVIQCAHCNEYALADAVMAHVDKILDTIDKTTELEVVRYAA
ncbi:MAG: YgiT-type zinc finger protein [Deltaproteobacteria bacterium]|nr:YgiT-type zinc finger protein [Deltaproteobacteria bacterium]